MMQDGIMQTIVSLDLTLEQQPSEINVYKGAFSNGGIYTLYHSPVNPIRLIRYGRKFIDIPTYSPTALKDVFVQTFERNGITVISLHYSHIDGPLRFKSLVFEISDSEVTHAVRNRVAEYVDGPITLPLDLQNDTTHPFILKSTTSGLYNGRVWSLVSTKRDKPVESPIQQLRHYMGVIFITPIKNIDSRPAFPGGPVSSLNSCCTKFNLEDDGKHMDVWIKRFRRSIPFRIVMPPIVHGIFKPRDIVVNSPHFESLRWFSVPLIERRVTIDVGYLEPQSCAVIIMSNLRRGDWIYTQHSITPLFFPEYWTVDVINSAMKREIYTSEAGHHVSYVEVFDNLINNDQFVVVNIVEWDGMQAKEKKNIYVREAEHDPMNYHHLGHSGTELCLSMLYNIDTAAARHYATTNEQNEPLDFSIPSS
ncbi:spherical body protein, putative [Babesia ovis]|uniref:Spherical body protein, putative n=1 Tax=Babesia ovis TaxID=5869 RepID=A0A9W5WUQ7_BABOV|nr:spherical body protein, putative [Babesia ovis]